MSIRRTALVLTATALSSCGYPTYAFERPTQDSGAIDDATNDVSNDAADAIAETKSDVALDVDARLDAGPCPILEGGDVCSTIPKFTAGSQTLDGDGSEFCDIRATKLVATSGADMSPTPPPGGIDTVVWIRAAWSSEALHVHVHVDQGSVYAPRPTEEIWRGDAIELFAAGFDTVHGPFDDTSHDVGAFQIIVAPPDGSLLTRSERYTTIGSTGTYPLLAARRVTGGYDVEVKYLWSDLHGTPSSGTGIAFDLGVDVRQSAAVADAPLLQSFLYFLADPGSSSCDPASRPNGHPSCDDTTWCKPKLE